jgi:predicted phosphodiesterase
MTEKQVNRYAANYHRYELKASTSAADFTFMLTSDWHFDNPKTNRALLFKHLDAIKVKNGYIIINGDMLCLMQGKYDPRKNKSAILPEHNGDAYIDLVIDDTAKKMLPYAHNILQINKGNHETGVSSRLETDILQRLVEKINTLAGSNIQLGEYMGYITLSFHNNGTHNKALNIAYDHGHWGGVITKGALSVVRHSSIYPDADVVISGHTHDGFIMNHPQLRMNRAKRVVEVKNQWHVKTGTYKEEFESGKGWAVEKIGMPKYLGSCFMNVYYNRNSDLEYNFTLTY